MPEEGPPIIYTEDVNALVINAREILIPLGLSLLHFPTNEAASVYLTSSPENVPSGALVDFNTPGGIDGVQLLLELSQSEYCGDVLVLCSIKHRSELYPKLVESGIEGRVELFRKDTELVFACVYIAIRVLYPEIQVTRTGILKAVGLPVNIFGDADEDNTRAKGDTLRNEILRDSFDLTEFAHRAQNLSIEEVVID